MSPQNAALSLSQHGGRSNTAALKFYPTIVGGAGAGREAASGLTSSTGAMVVTVVDGPLKRKQHHAAADENRERDGDDESPQPRSFASAIDRVNARVDGIHFIHGSALQDGSSQTTCLFLARSVPSQGVNGTEGRCRTQPPDWSADARNSRKIRDGTRYRAKRLLGQTERE
jgi:hypothetical protein